MTDRITTAQLSNLVDIFDPKVQEADDVGGARILYTFTEDGQTTRERVGESFIVDVLEPEISFFVSAPIDGNIEEGTISTAKPLEGLQDRYQLTKQQLEELIFAVSTALDYGEDAVADLLEK